MRRRRLLILGVAALVAFAVWVAITRTSRYPFWYKPPVIALPNDDDVAELRASLRGHSDWAAVPEFTVPVGHVPRVLDILRPGDFCRDGSWLSPHCELGEVVIRTRAGEEMRLRFYWTGKNPVVFTADGAHQYFGNSRNPDGSWMDGGIALYTCLKAASEDAAR
jgi:hypothetical protein